MTTRHYLTISIQIAVTLLKCNLLIHLDNHYFAGASDLNG